MNLANQQITALIDSLGSLDPISLPPSRYGSSQNGPKISWLARENIEHAQRALLTLHFVYPHELLPALDLLDRQVITRMYAHKGSRVSSDINDNQAFREQACAETFYIQSASAVTSKAKNVARFQKAYNPSDTQYEVRLDAWNCSCPAFAYSALGQATEEPEYEDSGAPSEAAESAGIQDVPGGPALEPRSWNMAGRLAAPENDTPICKHILAAVLGRVAPSLFTDGIKNKYVTIAEAAGWGGGWGD